MARHGDSFGEWLRRLRKSLDLTQRALAQAASCSEDAIRKIEADERRPSRHLAERLAARLGIPPEERTAFIDAARVGGRKEPFASDLATTGEASSGGESTSTAGISGKYRATLPVAPSGATFVGREREMATMRAALGDAFNGRGAVIALAGEPGIGKTRMSTEFVSGAQDTGAEVLWGRCHEGAGAPPFWPWVQIIRDYVEQSPLDQLEFVTGTGAPLLAELVPELRMRLPGIPVPPTMEPDQARFRLFDAVARFLRATGRTTPLVVVLEDVHWADHPSLRLIEFLASELAGTRVILVITYRDADIARGHPLFAALGELTRHGVAIRIPLRGLSREDVGSFIEGMIGRDATTPEIVSSVHATTEGNPLFVTEVVRLISHESPWSGRSGGGLAELRIPEGVKEVIGRRLDKLSAGCNELLTVAAVIGRQFRLEHLTRLMPQTPVDDLLDGIDEGLAARVIEEMPHPADTYQFTHALVGETLALELSTTRRVRLHARIGSMLEALYDGRLAEHAAELAHHFAEAAPIHGTGKLVQYCLLAGEQALSAFAFEQALEHFQRALDAKGSAPMDAQTAEILFGYSRAAMTGLERHRFVELIASLEKAFHYFVSTGNIGKAVEIADRGFPHFMGVEGTLRDLIERALALVPADSNAAARLLTRKGRILGVSVGDDHGARTALAQALSIARRDGDSAVERRSHVAAAYVAFFNLRQLDGIAAGRSALALAEQSGAVDDAAAALYFIVSCARHRGDVDTMQSHIEALHAAARKCRNRFWISGADWLHETLERIRGNWTAARSISDHGLEVSPNDIRLLSTRALMEHELGEVAQARMFLERLLASIRLTPPGSTPEYGMGCATFGMAADRFDPGCSFVTARELADAVLLNPTPASGLDIPAKLTLALQAIHREDVGTVGRLWPDLVRHRHPLFLPGTHCYDRFLGRLASSLGRQAEARCYFEEAIDLCRRINYPAELAWSLYDHARLYESARPRLPSEVRLAAEEALEISSRLGMLPLRTRVEGLLSSAT